MAHPVIDKELTLKPLIPTEYQPHIFFAMSSIPDENWPGYKIIISITEPTDGELWKPRSKQFHAPEKADKQAILLCENLRIRCGNKFLFHHDDV